MINFSTLIYIVNGFQSNNSAPCKVENDIEDKFASMEFEPSENSIKNILDFARSYEVLETENTGKVEMILN